MDPVSEVVAPKKTDSRDSLMSTTSIKGRGWNRVQAEIQRDYEQLQRSISQEFHK